MDQDPRRTVKGNPLDPCDHASNSAENPGGNVITQTHSSSGGGVAELEARVEGFLVATTPDQPKNATHAAPLRSGSQVSATIGSLVRNPTAFASNATSAAGTGDIKNEAQAFVLTRVRAIILVYAAKLPIVGSYFISKQGPGGSNTDALAAETTPLLAAVQDPKAFATNQAKGLLLRILYPLLSYLPDVNALDDAESDNHGLLFKTFVECHVLARDGGGWLFTHLQEHSLVIAPIVSLGHLSTTDLAASSIGTAAASVTGYSIIQGFISSLDEVLVNAPNHHVAKIACAQAAVVTGVVLFPITNLWAVQSAILFQRLGQPPEVAGLASEFLRITAAGLPGYAIGEIAKRYLASQGLSYVHTRILSATVPLNLGLNYLLVDGPIPALRLGFAGAPLCSVLSHNALAIMLIIYIVQRAIREEVAYLRGRNIIPDEHVCTNNSGPASDTHSDVTFFTGIGALTFAGVSGVLKSASQLWSKDFGGVIASILGPNALATQAVLHTTATTLYQAPKAMSNASSDRIKKWIAKGDVQRAKIASTVAFVATLVGVIVISNILLASAMSWGKLFNSDPVIIQNVAALLPVMVAFQAVHGIGAWVDSSLGSLGKTAIFPAINASADYILGIPLGVYLALLRQWDLAGLWVGLTVSLAYSCLVATVVLVRSNWKNAVGRKVESIPREEEAQPTTEPIGFGVSV